jgi:glutaredoxin 3
MASFVSARAALFAARRGLSTAVEANPAALSALIASEPILVFSKTYCGPSSMTKALFKQVTDLPVRVVELDVESNGAEVQRALAELTGQRTVPNVFVGGKHVGGCDDTHAADASGDLERMLNGIAAGDAAEAKQK